MHVVLCDTHLFGVSKSFAGGLGVGRFRGGGVCGRVIRRFVARDRWPVALVFAYLAAGFRRLGHTVQYVVDRCPPEADLYVFCPALMTIAAERKMIAKLLHKRPRARVFVVGSVPSVAPEAFAGLDVTLIQGEAEPLCGKLDEAIERRGATMQLGIMEDLDELPVPDWSPFRPQQFRISYDFWRFPTVLVEQSRGCRHRCNYCPYHALGDGMRFRNPSRVGEEILQGARNQGFRSFKFRDPLFGHHADEAFHLAEILRRANEPIQFSIETRPDLLSTELLVALKRAGLTCVTFGAEGVQSREMAQLGRNLAHEERQRDFIMRCRALGIRTVASFMIGFPDDTVESIHETLRFARSLNPTFADFNLLTPYPGTDFAAEHSDWIESRDFRRYTSHEPVLKYESMTAAGMLEAQARCYRGFYCRWDYLRENGTELLPWWRRSRPSDAESTELEGQPWTLTPDDAQHPMCHDALHHEHLRRNDGTLPPLEPANPIQGFY
jgi:radical SAM superfamily enzyme YgiQ (UPF0313 family)